jgi:hypothetical protein
MPNWCNNSVTIRGPKEKIESFQKFLDDNNGKDNANIFKHVDEQMTNVNKISVKHSIVFITGK